MTRSYKKTPIHKERANAGGKRRANRLVRRTRTVASHGGYRKVYPRYDIWERCSYYSKEGYDAERDALLNGLQNGGPDTMCPWYESDDLWKKFYHRK